MNQNVIDFPRDEYPAGFWSWVNENEHIYLHFKAQAIRMAMTGRKHYSARCIAETVRWETELRDSSVQFKLNNNMIPGMARLFMAELGHKFPEFFRLRNSLGYDE